MFHRNVGCAFLLLAALLLAACGGAPPTPTATEAQAVALATDTPTGDAATATATLTATPQPTDTPTPSPTFAAATMPPDEDLGILALEPAQATATTTPIPASSASSGSTSGAVGSQGSSGSAQSNDPAIEYFRSEVSSVDANRLRAGTARVAVSWTVVNRPAGTNLVFEQRFSDGTARSVELPRDFEIVPSAGQGDVAPFPPLAGDESILLALRLVELASDMTLATADLTLPVDEDGVSSDGTVPPRVLAFSSISSNACPGDNVQLYWETRGIQRVNVRDQSGEGHYIGQNLLPNGTISYALPEPTDPQATHAEFGLELLNANGQTITLAAPPPVVQVEYNCAGRDDSLARLARFTAEPGAACPGDTVTLTWEVVVPEGVAAADRPDHLRIGQAGDPLIPVGESLALTGSALVTLRGDADLREGAINFFMDAQNASGQSVRLNNDGALQVALNCQQGPPDPGYGIVSFTAEPATARPGDTVTLSWAVTGTVGITLIDGYEQRFPRNIADGLPNSGTYQFTIPPTYSERVPFILRVEGPNYSSDFRDFDVLSAEVALTCGRAFFFGTDPADPDTCPYEDRRTVQAAYQPFEGGFMLWLPADSGPAGAGLAPFVHLLLDGGSGRSIRDNWDGQEITWEEAPPQGRQLPQHGFGLAWTSDPSIREAAGWATGPEQGYSAQVQWASSGPAPNSGTSGLYLTLPDGRVIFLYTSFSLTWRAVN